MSSSKHTTEERHPYSFFVQSLALFPVHLNSVPTSVTWMAFCLGWFYYSYQLQCTMKLRLTCIRCSLKYSHFTCQKRARLSFVKHAFCCLSIFRNSCCFYLNHLMQLIWQAHIKLSSFNKVLLPRQQISSSPIFFFVLFCCCENLPPEQGIFQTMCFSRQSLPVLLGV